MNAAVAQAIVAPVLAIASATCFILGLKLMARARSARRASTLLVLGFVLALLEMSFEGVHLADRLGLLGVVIGVVAGLAALAKVSGLAMIVPAVAVLIWVERQNVRRLVVHLPLMLGAFAVVAGWWYLRNWFLYGEWTGTEMMLRIFGARSTPLTPAQLLTQLGEVWETFWVGFGWGNIRVQPVVYNALAVLGALSVLGLLVGLVRQCRSLRERFRQALPLGLLAAWAGIVFVALLRWMMMTQAPHGRLLFPALPALMPLALLGLAQWVPVRVQPLLTRGLATALFALAAGAPFFILAPAYAYPPTLSDNEVQTLAHRVDLNYDNQIKLLGYEVTPTRVTPGGALQLNLYWQSLAEMDRDYSIGIHLLDPGQRVIGARDSYPGHGTLPTRLWHAGQIIRDTYWVPVAPDAPAPGLAQIQIALYDRTDKSDLTALDPNGEAITPLIGRFKLIAPNPVLVRASHPIQYTFGNQIELTGFDLQSERALDLTLYWKSRAPMDLDYTVFVHVLDANGKIISQCDRQPQDGANPTSLWGAGEQVIDRYSLDLPAGAPAARQIELGVYRADTGARLPVVDAAGRAQGDHLILPSQ